MPLGSRKKEASDPFLMYPASDQAKTETASAWILLVSLASRKDMALILVKTFLAFGLKRNWSFLGGRLFQTDYPVPTPCSYQVSKRASCSQQCRFTRNPSPRNIWKCKRVMMETVIIYSVLSPKVIIDATSLRLGFSVNCHTVPTSVHQALLSGCTEHSHFSGKREMHPVTLFTMQGQRDGSGYGCLH